MAHKTKKQLAEELALAYFKAPFQFARDLAQTAGEEIAKTADFMSGPSNSSDHRNRR